MHMDHIRQNNVMWDLSVHKELKPDGGIWIRREEMELHILDIQTGKRAMMWSTLDSNQVPTAIWDEGNWKNRNSFVSKLVDMTAKKETIFQTWTR